MGDKVVLKEEAVQVLINQEVLQHVKNLMMILETYICRKLIKVHVNNLTKNQLKEVL